MKIRNSILCVIYIASLLSCKKILDVKSDKSLSTINSLADLEKMLDWYQNINTRFPVGSEILSDNYYLTFTDWSAMSRDDSRDYYIWNRTNKTEADWNITYSNIYICNLVLETLKSRKWENKETEQANVIEGRALFLRSSYFYSLSQLFAKVYEKGTAGKDLGIVLRLTTDTDEDLVRVSLQKTYDQIIGDLKSASELLPKTEAIKSRPSKAAAYGALARTYLSMSDYPNALTFADSCLNIYSALMDYNSLDSNSTVPIKKFNEEIIFQGITSATPPLSPTICKMDSILISSYEENDLRKSIFYSKNADNSYSFKGDYDGSVRNGNGHCFTGIATDEQYLILAESYARTNNIREALNTINFLLKSRWKKNLFEPFKSERAADVLNFILQERRKGLVFRTLRFTDLRRLNLEDDKRVTLQRIINNDTIYLPPNSDGYTLKIPESIIMNSNILQNP